MYFYQLTQVTPHLMYVSSLSVGTAAQQRSPATRTSLCRLELVPVIVSG